MILIRRDRGDTLSLLVQLCVCVFIKLHITTQSGPVILVCVCVCVCVYIIPFILVVRLVDAPYQPGSHRRRKVTQDFSTFLLRCLPSFLSREGYSRPFPSSTVKSNFVYP